ncbi:unnamed protein product [Cuscuta campestris]|uniref:Glutaredoxin domain-containing protein n=1 Tax=Cuscuta campestris TaxID=132261 RepID=A0A484MJP6_9ASTE|nr:unnamed protein product [Cuscuta campestris]
MQYPFVPPHFPAAAASSGGGSDSNFSLTFAPAARLGSLVSENAIIVFGRRGCCMSHVVQRLLFGLGVNPTIYDLDEEDEPTVAYELSRIISCAASGGSNPAAVQLPPFPAIFIGGKLFGGVDEVIAAHISGDLVPLLRRAGALWL